MFTRKPIFRMFSVLLIVTFLLISSLPVQAESFASPLYASGDYAWAKGISGTASSYCDGYSIAVDSSGNVYTTGSFWDTADFNPGAGTANLTSAGWSDIFVSKLDSNGNFLWAKSMGGAGVEEGLSIAIDTSGNVYTTGDFQGTADFDPGPGTFTLTNAGYGGAFISKLDNNGNFVWAKDMGGGNGGWVVGGAIAVDSSGNVYTTGHFSETADFDPGTGIFNLTNLYGGSSVFISKLDNNGEFVLAKNMGPTSNDGTPSAIGYGIAIGSNNNIYTAGNFYGTVDFDPGPGTFNLTSGVFGAGFLSVLDGNGDLVWAKNMGIINTDVVLDPSGNVYVTGSAFNSASSSRTEENIPFPFFNIFVSKLDSNGNLIWEKGMGGTGSYTGYQQGISIALDPIGYVYTTGSFEDTADFDPGSGTFNLTSAGYKDIFVSKLDNNGGFVWAKSMGGSTGDDQARSIAIDSDGNVYTTGSFQDTADFDPGPGVANLISAGGSGTFVSKLQSFLFADVPSSYWAQPFIVRLYSAGITGGCLADPLSYCPEADVTRAQMAVFLLRGIHGAAYTPPTATGTMFGDVPSDYWAADWIEQLFNEGITAGCSNGNYCPEVTVTRDQMAVFLLRAEHGASYTPPPATGVFTDVPSDYWAADWIEQLAVEGITGGCGAGVYCPTTPVTRAQMAVFLVRTFNLP